MPQKNAEIYLNTTVYQLRRLLDNYGLRERLHSDNNHYALDLHQVRVDMVSFEEGCKEMTVVNQLNLDQAIELQQLYAGDLFGDRAFPWAWSEVERLSQLYSSFTQRLCTALLAKGDTQMAIRLLLKLFVRNELNEETFKLLMRALALKKDKEGLTQHYIKFTENMRKELGLSPSLEVAALYRRLLSKMESA
jgi:two-component SAPR family response regulator